MKQNMKRLLLSCALTLCAVAVLAQVKIDVQADKSDWTYKTGEKVKFTVTITKDGRPFNGEAKYMYGKERLEDKRGDLILKNGKAVIETPGLAEPGFLRFTATVKDGGKSYKGVATAGISPLEIQPTVEMPADFDAFWAGTLAQLKKIKMNAKVYPSPELSTATVNAYTVVLQNFGGGKIYGIMCKPKAPGKYPAILYVPGAGVRAYKGAKELAEKGAVTFQIGIHGIPVNYPDSLYQDMRIGPLKGYPTYDMSNKDKYYYRKVYAGCVRAIDFLVSQPDVDADRIAVAGGSQGGALSIVTAALDPRVKFLASQYAALCDLTGYLEGRAGGWPHMFRGADTSDPETKLKLETAKYYDVVNFAKKLKVPGFYTWGYNDPTCPPTSFYAAYNSITAPKEVYVAKEMVHRLNPLQRQKINDWLTEKLGIGK